MDKLNQIAATYIGTPHINGGQIKGVGLDCCTLMSAIYKEIGVDIPVATGYSADWFCRRGCELIKPYLDEHFDKVEELQPGDLVSFSYGRAKFAHLAMYLGGGRLIHCGADQGVELTDFNNPSFFKAGISRIAGYWRLKNGLFIWRTKF